MNNYSLKIQSNSIFSRLCVSLILVNVAFGYSADSAAAGVPGGQIPGGVTPGGAMPQISNQPEPFVYPSYSKPAEPERVPIVDDSKAPRMLLKGFELFGIKDHPEHNISLKLIQQLIADETAIMIKQGEPRLFTISMFEQIANAITRYYRAQGYFLARAYVPQQKVKDGIVKLKVVESYLDKVVFDGNELYDDESMQVLFEDLLDKPIYIDDFNEALYKLNDYPGLTAMAVFGPGSESGSAAIVMRTEEVFSSDMLSLDNYGSAFTGENRLLYRHRNNNLFGQADLLAVNVMTTISPSNNQYADLLYVQPVFKSLFKVGGGVVVNFFEVGESLEDLGISGESFIVNGFIDYKFIHSRLDQLSFVGDLSLKSASSKIVDIVASEDNLTVVRFDALYSGIDRWLWNASHEASASVSIGLAGVLGAMDENGDGLSGRLGASGRAGGDFTKINLAYTRLQPTFDLQSLLFRFQAQFSSDLLTSLEQYSLGGPYNVRAYPVADFLADNAIFTSFEYIFTASPDIKQTWLNRLQLSLFYDYAKGEINDPIINEIASANLSALGFGIQVEPFNKFRVRLDFATALGDEPLDLQSLPFYLSMEYRF